MGTLGAALESIHSTKKSSDVPKSDKIVMIHYSKLRTNKKQYRNEGKTEEVIKQEIEDLAFELRAAGKILSPCTVRKIGTDEYEMIGGHHRRDAAILNVEKYGLKSFEFIPSIIETNISDVQAEYRMFSDNEQVPKTDWQIMHELERRKALIEAHPEEFPLLQGAGRIVDKLATITNMSKSTIGEYLQISKNLSDTAMDAFKEGALNKSAAVAIASLPLQEQDKLLDAGITKQKDIKAYKEEKVEKTTHRTTVTDTVKTIKTYNSKGEAECKAEEEPVSVIDVLPGQYRVANTDMELEEETTETKLNVDSIQGSEEGICNCHICKQPSRVKDTFTYYGKTYCMNCLFDLIIDFADKGVITLDRSAIEIKGIVIHS